MIIKKSYAIKLLKMQWDYRSIRISFRLSYREESSSARSDSGGTGK